MRRVDLIASGLRHLAYYSEEPRAFHGMMFCLPGLAPEQAKRLSIWFDSSLNQLQMLVSRISSRGGWTEYNRNTVAKFYAPNPLEFDDEDNRILENEFREMQDVEFPRIAEQLVRNTPADALSGEEYDELKMTFPDRTDELGTGFQARRLMDRAILTVLGFDQDRHKRILALL